MSLREYEFKKLYDLVLRKLKLNKEIAKLDLKIQEDITKLRNGKHIYRDELITIIKSNNLHRNRIVEDIKIIDYEIMSIEVSLGLNLEINSEGLNKEWLK